jgi:uncharacterized SAM-binding protein YcdF (DUF218 family)
VSLEEPIATGKIRDVRADPPLLLFALFWLIAAAGALTARRVRKACGGDEAVRADLIVVFGAATPGGSPSAELRARLAHAAGLFADELAPIVVCSGGHTEGVSEARVMRRTLSALVPEARIEIDEHGSSNRATVANARGRGSVLFVSSPYHVHRIAVEARRQEIDARVCAAPGCPVALQPRAWRRALAREVLAVWWYAVGAAGAAHAPRTA